MARKKLEENMEEGAKRVKGFFTEFKTKRKTPHTW
jgi:hypothetical protein